MNEIIRTILFIAVVVAALIYLLHPIQLIAIAIGLAALIGAIIVKKRRI